MNLKLALKINVATLRGALRGVPVLIERLRRHSAGASFLFSLGPDRTGRAWRSGFAGKPRQVSALSHYGVSALLYGTLLPPPDIGRRAAEVMRATRDVGFETAIHCWDYAAWLGNAENSGAAWAETEMRRAHDRYREIFGVASPGHGAAGWQLNAQALRMMQRLGYRWASDCRGRHPFMPVWNAEVIHCPQLPTTLSTLDELIGTDDLTADNVHLPLLRQTAEQRQDHVFTLHAELEGLRLGDTLERLLAGWREQGYELVSLTQLRDTLDPDRLPRHEMIRGEIPGRFGTLMLQGEEFLSTWQEAA